QSLDAAALGLPLQLTNICEQGRNGGAVEFVGLVSRNQLQYGTTMFTAPAKIVSNVNFGSISVHPRSSAVRFSRASVKIAAAQKEVTVWALEFATRFQHLCAAIGADRGYIGERRSSLRRWDADGFALSVHWANVQFRPSDGANPRSKPCGNTGYSRIITSAAPLLSGVTVKIVVFGLTISSSWGNGHATPYRAILRALSAMGHDVQFFEKDVEYYRSRRDFASCDYCRLTLYPDWKTVRPLAMGEAASADVVITASYLPEGRRINDEILELERPLRVFYDLDTPITLRGVELEEGGIDYLGRDQIAGFDLVLSFAGGKILGELQQKFGARMARPLYGCIDPDDYFRVATDAAFACDLSYMATYAPDRQAGVAELFLEPARRHPEKAFILAGSMYPWDWPYPANVRHVEHVEPQAHRRFYSSSRITLNITRQEMAHN